MTPSLLHVCNSIFDSTDVRCSKNLFLFCSWLPLNQNHIKQIKNNTRFSKINFYYYYYSKYAAPLLFPNNVPYWLGSRVCVASPS